MATIFGTEFDDQFENQLEGTAGDDTYFGFAGEDWIIPSLGSDVLDGGADFDVAIYDTSPLTNGITINNTSQTINGLAAFTVDKGAGEFDTLISIENFHGTDFDDVIYIGGLGDTYSFDMGGNDYVEASQDPNVEDGHFFVVGSGTDTFVGTVADNDTVDFRFGFDSAGAIFQGVNVNLATGVAVDGWGFTDTLIGIERAYGTDFDDVMVGNDERNRFRGFEGNDTFDGAGGDRNLVDYSRDDAGVFVDLDAGTATDGWGDTDTFVNIQEATGSDFGDTLWGDGEDNRLVGKGGDDTIRGFGGDDRFEGGDGSDTIDGGEGWDEVDYDGEDGDGAVTVNLTTGVATDTFGNTDTLIEIEGVEGTDGDDSLTGNDDDNDLRAGDGNDTLVALGGYDYLEGGAGNDSLYGGDDDDNLRGGQGDDILDGGAGDRDRVEYHRDGDEGATSGVDVDLQAGTATDGFGNTDTLIGIEEARGSEFDDVLRGRSDVRSHLRGEDGDDTLIGRSQAGQDGDNLNGGAGNDTLVGGDSDRDYAEYGFDDETFEGINANLTTGIVTDGRGGTDTISGIESIGATRFGDTITGTDGENFLEGREGDDTLFGGAGDDQFRGGQGNDILDGGSEEDRYNGGDRAEYDRDHEDGGFQGIDGSLITGIVIDTFGDTDTLIDIEEIYGSIFDDTITGSDGDERLSGEDGNDTITGNGGNDDLRGGAGDDTIYGGEGGDFLQPGKGADVIDGGAPGVLFESDELAYYYDSRDSGETGGISVTFTGEMAGSVIDYGGDTDTFTGINRILGTNNDDSFVGADGDQEFRGYAGDDFFDGGAGDGDEVSYRTYDDSDGATQGIVLSLDAGTATDTFGDTDTLVNIESIRGSRFDDTITGDDNHNELQGEDGDDVIDSFGGQYNYMRGGSGNDTFLARGDGDFVDAGDGNDTITFFGSGGGANPGLGSDVITGGTDGFFSINYNGIGEGVVIDTALGTTTLAGGDVDSFTNIRNVGGGDGDDIIRGDDDADRQEFFTSLGDDSIDGRGGGRDWLIYDERDETAITIDFSTGVATGDYAGTDTFVNIEAVRGTHGADTFIGGDQDYTEYQGLDGVDTYVGGSGLDRLSFTFDDNRGGTGAITVDLAAGTAIDGFGNAETFTGIEQVISSDFNDTLTGDANENVLIGLSGQDTIYGGDGDDGIYAGDDEDMLTGGAGADEFGGRLFELDGDTITDFSAEDSIAVFDNSFNYVGANMTIVGDELRIDVDGDGAADATMFLTNGYSGPVTSAGGGVGGVDTLEISVEDAGLFTASVDEGSGSVTLTLTRAGDTTSTATVDVTVNGTGLNPADGNDISSPLNVAQTVTFLPGETTATLDVVIADDGDIEAAEDLIVQLSNPTTDGEIPATLGGDETFIRILNDDMPETVNVTGDSTSESSGELTFTVERTGDTTDDLIVNYSLRSAGGLLGAESDDIAGALPDSGTVTILAGQSTATISVPIIDDDVAETHDNIILSITADASWPSSLSVGVREAVGSIRNDDGVPTDLPTGAGGSSFGDPHIVTLDGLAYDFQAVGEFTLIESVSGDPLNVQVRYGAVEGSDIASETTAVATTMGTARVTIDIAHEGLMRVDGVDFDLFSATGGASVGDGDVYFDGEAITLVYANGEQLRIDVFDSFLNTSITLDENRDVRGLIGNGDGSATNDLALRDGTVFTQPISYDDLYGPYADEWRISDATSLFDYPAGLGTADFTDLSFPSATLDLDDIPAELLAEATAATAGITDPVLRDAAILDALLTGDVDAAVASAETSTTPTAEADVTDVPDMPAAVGVISSDAEIIEGDDGVQSVVFTIYRTGDLSGALDVGYAFSGAINATDASGIDAGMASFAAGEAAITVEVGINGDEVAEDNEDLIMTISVSSGSTLVINSTAKVTVLDNDSPLVGTSEDDVIIGGTSEDSILGFGGDDELRGLQSDDVISGGDGRDQIWGASGDDTIYGDAGIDFVRGGPDNDLMFGGDDNDIMRGQRHNDEMYGGDGNDNINGGGGNDVLFGDAGNDFVKGGSRKDTLFGGDGDDIVSGNKFDDTLFGGAGDDTLNSGGNNDRLDGGTGNDFLRGGSGADVFVFDLGHDIDTVDDFSADDRLEISAALAGGQSAADIAAGASSDGSGGLIISLSSGDEITLEGFNDTTLLATLIDIV